MARIANATRLIFTITDQIARLSKEQERTQNQVAELTKVMFSLNKDVATISGQMLGIEKRLEDREKLMEMTIAVRVREEVEKAMKGRKPPEA